MKKAFLVLALIVLLCIAYMAVKDYGRDMYYRGYETGYQDAVGEWIEGTQP